METRGSEEEQLPGVKYTHNQIFFINFAQVNNEVINSGTTLFVIMQNRFQNGASLLNLILL